MKDDEPSRELLPLLEHGVALTAALGLSYGIHNAVVALLAANAGGTAGPSLLAGFVSGARTAAILAAGVVLLDRAARESRGVGLAIACAIVSFFLPAIWTVAWWVVSLGPDPAGLSTGSTKLTFDDFIRWGIVAQYTQPVFYVGRLLGALALFLGVRNRGRLLEGFFLTIFPALFNAGRAVFARWPGVSIEAYLLGLAVLVAAASLLVPLSERLVVSALVAMGVRDVKGLG